MVTLSAWSLLKISKASWRPNDISSLIPVGDTGKWPQSQHQDPINFIVTLVRPQRQPWLQLREAQSREAPDQTGGPRLFQLAANPPRRPWQRHPLHPAGLRLHTHVTCGGWSLECLVKGNESQSAKRWIARNICKCTFCHRSVPYFSRFSCHAPFWFSVKFHPAFPGI